MAKVGRKCKYFTNVEPRLEEIKHWCRDGFTLREMCERLHISHESWCQYLHKYPEFSESIKLNKEVADYRVEDALYFKAIGYELEEEHYEGIDEHGNAIIHTSKKRFPPDTAAAFIWLKNRRPSKWRDKSEVVNKTTIQHKIQKNVENRIKEYEEYFASLENNSTTQKNGETIN